MSVNSIDSDQYVDGSIDTVHIGNDQVTTVKLADTAVTTVKIQDNAVTTNKIAADAVNGTKIPDNAIQSEHIAANAVTTAKIADAELTTLAGMQSGTASVLAGGTALTSTLTELNQLDGKTIGETTLTTNSDTAIPTSKAVNDRILTVTNALGGFVAIADKDNFPTSNPDPSDGAGTVVSISNAAGISVNSSGVGSLATRAGGSDAVVINGFPSALRGGATVGSATNADPYVLPSSVGLQVQTTSTAHTYDYHKYLINEEDANKLSGDIQDFQERYRVAASAPTSSKDDGDLWFDTTNNKMKVYNASGSSWDDVAAPGNFFINTISSSSGTGGGSATFNGTAYRFTLSSPPSQGAQQLLISINGVVQKPNSGTSQPAEGFAVDTNDVIFSAAPPSGSDYFIITFGNTVNIGTPSDNTVATAKIQNLAVTTDKLADNSVTAKIADDAVGAEHIEDLDASVKFVDSAALVLGTGNDLRILHDGTDHVLTSDGGQNIRLVNHLTGGNETMAKFIPNGAVELYHNGVKTFQTDSNGISVLGPEGGDGKIYLQADEGDDIADKWQLVSSASGGLYINNYTSGSWETNIKATGNGNVELYYDNSKKLETVSWGVDCQGNTRTSGDFVCVDGGKFRAGNSSDFQIYHDGSNSYIKNDTNDLAIESAGDVVLRTAGSENAIKCLANSSVELYHNNNLRLTTGVNGVQLDESLFLYDSKKIELGHGGNLELYHDGTSSVIKDNSAQLYIRANAAIKFQNDAVSETFAKMHENGNCELYYDNSKKFETNSAGTKVFGSAYISEGTIYLEKSGVHHHRILANDTGNDLAFQQSSDSGANSNFTSYLRIKDGGDIALPVDGKQLLTGAGEDLRLYHDGNNSFVNSQGNGHLFIRGDDVKIQDANAGHNMAVFIEDGAVELYYDNAKKFETKSGGVEVTGSLVACQNASDSDHATGQYTHVLQTQNGGYNTSIIEHSSDSNPFGMLMDFSDDDPDNNTNYFIKAQDSSATRFYVYSDGDVWNHDDSYTGSDQTLKENIVDATSKLEDLKKLKVRKVEEIFPSLISEHDIAAGTPNDDHVPVMKKAIKQAWDPIIIKAMQELIAKVETLETKVAALEAG